MFFPNPFPFQRASPAKRRWATPTAPRAGGIDTHAHPPTRTHAHTHAHTHTHSHAHTHKRRRPRTRSKSPEHCTTVAHSPCQTQAKYKATAHVRPELLHLAWPGFPRTPQRRQCVKCPWQPAKQAAGLHRRPCFRQGGQPCGLEAVGAVKPATATGTSAPLKTVPLSSAPCCRWPPVASGIRHVCYVTRRKCDHGRLLVKACILKSTQTRTALWPRQGRASAAPHGPAAELPRL